MCVIAALVVRMESCQPFTRGYISRVATFGDMALSDRPHAGLRYGSGTEETAENTVRIESLQASPCKGRQICMMPELTFLTESFQPIACKGWSMCVVAALMVRVESFQPFKRSTSSDLCGLPSTVISFSVCPFVSLEKVARFSANFLLNVAFSDCS